MIIRVQQLKPFWVPEHDLIETVGLTNQFHAYKSLYESHGDAIINQRYGEQILTPIYLHQLKYETSMSNGYKNL